MRSIAALVMLGVIGGGGSVFGRCRRCVLLSNLSVGWCGSLDMFAKCLLRRFDCSLGEGIVLLFVVMASCVSGASVNVLLRLCISLQSLEGFVLYVIVLRSCFHLICCSCWISSCISLLSVFILLMISGEGSSCLRWFLVRILFLMYLWNPGL